MTNTPNYKKWTPKYYKGLGTSKDAEIKDDYSTPRVVLCDYDIEAPSAMRLVHLIKDLRMRERIG